MIDNSKLNFYSFDEIAKLYNQEERLILIDVDKETEFVGRYEDISDIIVGLNEKIGNRNLIINSFDTGEHIASTNGLLLKKCNSKVRAELEKGLYDLLINKREIKDFKLIKGLDLMDFCDFYERDRLIEK